MILRRSDQSRGHTPTAFHHALLAVLLITTGTALSQQQATPKASTGSTAKQPPKRSSVTAAAVVDGKWVAKTPSGVETYAFKSSGTKLEGSISETSGAERPISDGKVGGDKISFVDTIPVGGEDFKFLYKGVVKGDTIEMTRESNAVLASVGANAQITTTHPAPMKFTVKKVSYSSAQDAAPSESGPEKPSPRSVATTTVDFSGSWAFSSHRRIQIITRSISMWYLSRMETKSAANRWDVCSCFEAAAGPRSGCSVMTARDTGWHRNGSRKGALCGGRKRPEQPSRWKHMRRSC